MMASTVPSSISVTADWLSAHNATPLSLSKIVTTTPGLAFASALRPCSVISQRLRSGEAT